MNGWKDMSANILLHRGQILKYQFSETVGKVLQEIET